MSIHFPCAHLIFWVMMRRKRSVFQYVFVQCLAQHEVSTGLIQKNKQHLCASSRPFANHVSCNQEETLAISTNGKKRQGMGSFRKGHPVPEPPLRQELSMPPCEAKGPFPNLSAKSMITPFWTHLHFPSCSFLHLSFQQLSHRLLSPLHRIFSCFGQSNIGFYFLFIPSVQYPHPDSPKPLFCTFETKV